jgi:aryl-alcohol dehydrogenase-like predicted oxidoreductase
VKTTTFGNSGLQVTPIGLGLAALGRPGYINLGHADDLGHDYDIAAMETHTHDILDEAWQAGIRYFDAARSYGRAEAFLGSWLTSRQMDPADLVVGSKWGYTYTADWKINAEKHEVKDHSLPVLNQQIQESRELLDGFLNIYQIHSATLESGVLKNQSVLKVLGHLREEGLIIGLSLSGPAQATTLRQAMKIEADGVPLFGSVQATWNLLAQDAGPALAEAHEAGMGVIIKEALANGRLTSRNNEPDFKSKLNLLEEIATELETTIDAVAIAGVLAQPWADIVLSGAARVDHLRSNLDALKIQWADDLSGRLMRMVEPQETYWKIRGQLDWN